MRAYRKTGRPAIELLEQAIALLRRTPLSALLIYYLGAIPFWLALMYFVADASRSAFAGERLAGASFTMAVLYLHMKCWQALFASHLRTLLLGTADEPWTWSRVWRLIATQAIWQPSGLILRPLAYLATLPAVWVSVFYHNLTVLGDGRAALPKSPARQAFAQAALWPVQAHGVFAWLVVFGFFVWVNVSIFLIIVPALLKMLLGWETMASRSVGGFVTNSTFPTVSIALTCLCLDPVWKAVFALRCFYGESVESGADLQVQLKGVRPWEG
jgi:hypothetical protein